MSRVYAALAVALVAGVAAIVWLATRSSTPDVISPARKVFGGGRVIHVLASLDIDPSGPAMRPITEDRSAEVWYDPSRRWTHVVLHRGTKVELDTVDKGLEPPSVPPVTGVPPALWEFVTGYRPALAHRGFRVCSSDRVQGRRVIWLCAPADSLDPVEVAVDPVSHEPIWLRSGDSPLLTELAVAETKPYDPADFLTARQKKPRHL
jgi:hypothetical protein